MSDVSYQKIGHLFMMLVLMTLAFIQPNVAFAQSTDGSVGGMIYNLAANFWSLPMLFTAVSYLLGLGFMVFSITQFIKHVDRPADVPLNDAIRMMLAGALFVVAPTFATYVVNTFGIDQAAPIASTGFNPMGGDEGTLDGMLEAFAIDIYPSMILLLGVFSYIAGITVLLVAIYRITTSFQQGAKGPLGLGTAMHFVVAAVLLSAPQALGAMSETLFGTSTIRTYAELSSAVGFDPSMKARAESIIAAVQTFMIIIGIISFIRGWFILKAAADGGGQQASTMAAFSHIIAGVLAVNIGPFINAVQQTFGLSPYNGIVFQ